MCVTTANDTRNIPMTKPHSYGAKAWEGLWGLCVGAKKCEKQKEKGTVGSSTRFK